MDYFYDLEFIEDGRTIELISIGIVSEDGREYYAVNSEAPWEAIATNDWLIRNVLPSLPLDGRVHLERYLEMPENRYPKPSLKGIGPEMRDSRVKPRWVIANEVRDFLLVEDGPVLWADYGAYDHVALCQLWGPMVALPKGLPMFTRDIQQEAARLGITDDQMPAQETGLHNALEDARHNQVKRLFLADADA